MLSCPRLHLAVVTLYDEKAKSYGDITAEGKERYCRHWGYDFVCWRELIDPSISGSWNKTLALQLAMEKFPLATHLFWSDADALLTGVQIPLAGYIDNRYQIQVSNDSGGINLGNFLIRSSPWAKTLLKSLRVYAQPGDPYHEQSALRNYLDVYPNQLCHFKHMGESFNSYPGPLVNFMLHCAGMSHEARAKAVKDASELITWVWPQS